MDNDGALYSRSGKIGGWNIKEKTLTGGNVIIDSKGSISNSAGGKGTWYINNDGTASFNHVTITGEDSSLTIGNTKIQVINGNGSFVSGGFSSSGGSLGSGGTSLISNGLCGITGTGTNGSTMEEWGHRIVTKYIEANIAALNSVRAKAIGVYTGISGNTSTGDVSGGTLKTTMNSLGFYTDAGGYVQIGNHQGDTGILTFDDGSKMYFDGGILYDVQPGSDADIIWS